LTGSYTNYEYPYRYRDSKGDYNFKRNPIYGAAAYSFDISDNSSLTLRAFYNKYGFEIHKTKYVNSTSDEIKSLSKELLNSNLYGVDAEYFLKSKNNEIVAGVSMLTDNADNIHALVTNESGAAVNIKEPMIAGGDGSFTRTTVGIFLQD